MVNYFRDVLYDIPTDTFGNVDTSISGTPIFARRPFSSNPAYKSILSDLGELRVVKRDNTLLYAVNTVINSADEMYVNNNGEVLIRKGTTLYFYSSGGVQVWTKTIGNLTGCFLSDSYVHDALNTAVAASSLVEWRSKTTGDVTNSYGIQANDYVQTNGHVIVAQPDGEIAYSVYRRGVLGNDWMESYDRVSGFVWAYDFSVAYSATVRQLQVSGDGSYILAHFRNGANNIANSYILCRIITNLGVLYGELKTSSQIAAVTNSWASLSVNGKTALYLQNATLTLAYIAPFSTTSITTPANLRVGGTDGIDIADDGIWFVVVLQDNKMYVYRLAQQYANQALNSSPPIAIIRNWAG